MAPLRGFQMLWKNTKTVWTSFNSIFKFMAPRSMQRFIEISR